MSGYDIIGDIHGCAAPLIDLLEALGYRKGDSTSAYRHPDRQAIFVGDLTDRGDEQLSVLEIVKQMVDSGSAQIVMGNHEFNAIAYDTARPGGSGEFLRPHSPKNTKQHQAFLDQVTGSARTSYLEWFTTMPLWLDLGGLRVVHACWHEPSLRVIEDALRSNCFSSIGQFTDAATKGNPLYEAIEVVLKGPEIGLLEYGLPPYRDKDGTTRDEARVAWWRESVTTLRDLVVMDGHFTTEGGQSYPDLSGIEVDESERCFSYRSDVPVFYGHYWRTGVPTRGLDWTAHTACVDFSAVKDGDLVAYRWDGESEIQEDHYFRTPVGQAKSERISPDSPSRIDLSWRPDTYFWPAGLEKQLLAKVKGAARRAALQRLIDEGRLVEIPDFLATAGLSDDERTAIGRIHPHFMGGEYLPDQDEGEIEIARIEIDSTTSDVTSVYAHQDTSTIRYRVVDEYGGETLRGATECASTRPLTLGELEEFFLGAWPFLGILEMNFETDTEQMLGFFHGVSQFYPEFDRLLRERVIAAYPESPQAKEAADIDDERIALGHAETGDPDPEQADLPSMKDGAAMSHRFAIIPAGSVDSVDQANELIHTMGAGSDGEPPTGIDELLDELAQSAAGSFSVTRPADSRGVIIATHRPEDGLLRYLLQLTMVRGLAVFDIELFRLYDPRGRVDVDVSLSGDLTLPYLTPTLLRDLVLRPTWPEPEYPYFIIARGGQEFVQAYRDDDGKYQFEHRDGGPDAHFAFRTADTGLVADVMWVWVTHDSQWRTAVPWSRMEFDDADEDNADEASSVPESQNIHVDQNSDRGLTFVDTDGEPFLAYHAGNPENEKDAEGRLIPTGWVLHVEDDEPFPTEVLDFDSVDEALARAKEHLGQPLPDTSPGPGRYVSLQNERRDDGSWLNLDASLDPDGTLRIIGQDLGPVAEAISPDGEYEYFYTIAAEDVPALVIALGGEPGTDVMDLLEQRWSGADSYGLGGEIRSSGVTYHFASYH